MRKERSSRHSLTKEKSITRRNLLAITETTAGDTLPQRRRRCRSAPLACRQYPQSQRCASHRENSRYSGLRLYSRAQEFRGFRSQGNADSSGSNRRATGPRRTGSATPSGDAGGVVDLLFLLAPKFFPTGGAVCGKSVDK
jgi:hypothetical protein